ncbi:D-alanyl-D-alanine carboxypeptidase [Clostridium tetanomorphum]|uniref:serine-type D-Ala-D-Ala carboxypeptidase n=1 Tax=Clostridium tetanomorphum TaxID=1553 RepID=A0A923E6D0_CLOTT|nr:D-alanyl-D-alanine carboxypeptidase family protein [Clostridium tetanomorphum]KAJ53823.1 D-alanyl-D-alanine carboxypeptidase [Clostridium tetanomorphum DSM 665]MBC2397337.1 D-alanyl-D-alanine carboxypeptidase [Clostridium tetanomorphum]MBP1862556.1 D-alanyl-D-alanine carboxypeptidase [Clostridium tetanomorphum]NRS85603.1 D-alanyl-D-alanine carboxypeptidase [Clostridium tetanomorphum]NRZ96386.1 D-alanyl-D-alanine carboxypeptidase [Clostridium tetanomorphum]
MKKTFTLFTTLFILFLSISSNFVNAKDAPPKVSAYGAILMDATTGTILYEKSIDKPYAPASTTKIMTALLTLENCKLDDIVTVGKKPPLADGSKIFIYENEKLKVKDLLYALLLESANDCAEALAEHIGGSIENFAKLMNERAKELGCKNTNFVNPSGLYDDKHRTTARDLALIMREVVKHPEYTKISTAISYKIAPTNKCKKTRPLWNKNKLIQNSSTYYYEGCEAGKTGYTIQSEHSYVASATRNDERLILALIHDKNKTFFPDAIKLFNYGYNNFELVKMYSKGDIVSTYNNKDLNINLLANDDFYYIKNKKDPSEASVILDKKDLSSLSFKKGDNISTASIILKDKSIGTLNLSSDSDHIITSYKFLNNKITSSKTLTIIISLTLCIIVIASIIKLKKRKANN